MGTATDPPSALSRFNALDAADAACRHLTEADVAEALDAHPRVKTSPRTGWRLGCTGSCSIRRLTSPLPTVPASTPR